MRSDPPPLQLVNVIEGGLCSDSKPACATYMTEVSESSPAATAQSSSYIEEPQIEELDEVLLNSENPDCIILVGSRLEANREQELDIFQLEHKDCFAEVQENLTGIDPSFITHQLKANPAASPVI